MSASSTNSRNDHQRPAAPKRRLQFSIWTMLVVMTAICIMLAIPGVAILFASVGFWLLVAAGVVLFILALQAPGYYILQRIRSAAAEDVDSAPLDETMTARSPDAPEDAVSSRCK